MSGLRHDNRSNRPPVTDPYAEIAELYDLEHGGHDEDIDLYLNLAMMVGDPILEAGRGSGRLLAPLAQAGHRVTGIDRSEAMLARAEQFIATLPLAQLITLWRGDVIDAASAPGGPFGLAIVALNGLLHLETPAAQRAALCSLHAVLDPRGQLVLDVLNPTPDALRALDGLHHEGSWAMPDGTKVDKFSSRRVHPGRQTIATELWYDLVGAGGALRRVATAFEMRYVHRAELELMLELAGFVEWHVYGGYDLEPFLDASDRLIVTAEVTPSP